MKSYCKLLLGFLIIESINTLAAETNLTFDVLHTAQGDFTNAAIWRLTPAYAVVNHANGLAKVWLTNLPPDLQRQLGYNPTNAAAALAAEEKKRVNALKARAENDRAIAALRGANQTIRITAIYDFGQFGRCQISTRNGGGGSTAYVGGTVYMSDIPDSVKDFYTRRAQLKADIAILATQPITVTATSRNTDDDASNSYMAAQDALYEAKQARDEKLKQMKEELAELNHAEADSTTVIAYPTGQSYGSFPIWQFVDVAPPDGM